uniref:Retrotransposon protein, putative, Ty3-gypsy sub-class n=2 Tax=Oryza sativa subsp. japonica TaxID=39947 RepID=Q2R5V3_ORYSJ|nr:retrotransposon protein, putative, Ty3-gypsy sub-class [Oryza sativa Japonica Group]ABA93173.1 retrotransposon protein, putative, Ty3-gypsy subclass [Oryza sativa Japonica Group]
MMSGNEIMPISLEELDEEQRQDMEEWIKGITQEVLQRVSIRTHQGVVLKPGPLPKYVFDDKGGSMGDYTADYTGIGYMQNLANDMTGRDTSLTVSYAGQTMPYSGQIGPPLAGLTAPLTTGQTGPWAGQTGSLRVSLGFHTTTSSTDFNYYSSPVNTVSHAIPHIPNAYNDINRGYPPDTRYGQYNNIVPQQSPFRPPSPPPDPPKPETMEDWFRNTIKENFAKLRNRAREYQKTYPDIYDIIPYPRGYKIPEFTKFSGEDSRTTWEHVDQLFAQCGEANWDTFVDYIERFRDIKSRCFSLKITDKDLANIAYDGLLDSIKEKLNGQIFLDVDHVLHEALAQKSRVDDNSLQASLDENAISCIAKPSDGSDCANNLCNDAIISIAEPKVGSDCLASLDNDATTIISEPSVGSDCVINLDNNGIAEPSDGSDCVASLENSIIENIAELSDGSDYITSENEIALSPKTESKISHVDIGKDDDNVLQDSGEIESKVAMHTYQRPYPEHVDSVPYSQRFEVSNFTKFTGENAMTTVEHISRFIDQCSKAGSDDLLKLKLFPLSLSNFASTWYSLLAPSSISPWSQMEYEFHDYFRDASLMEQRPNDTSSVTCETISVTPMPKTGIVNNSLPTSPIDVDKRKEKSVVIGDLRPKNRINNAKDEDRKVTKDESSSSQKTKKPKLTFEMLMAKYKKGLASQRFDNQTSDSKRPKSSRRKRFGQTPKQSEPSTIPTPYKPPVVMPWYPHPMSPFGYPFLYYMPWMPQPPMPCHQGWKQSPRTVPSHSNSRQDRFPQKNRSGGSKVKKVKKVWVRKEAKASEVVAIKEKSQDVQVPTEDAVKTIQAEKTEANAVAIEIGGLTKPVGRSNRQTTASLTDSPSRSDRRLVAGLTGPRGRSD